MVAVSGTNVMRTACQTGTEGMGFVLKKKKKKGMIIGLTIVLIFAAVLGAAAYFLYEKANSGLFFEETTLNGYDVSGKSAKEVLLMLTRDYSAPKLEIREGGETELTLTLEELGYTIDEMQLLSEIQDCMRSQNLSLLISLFEGNEYEVEVPFNFDEEVFKKAVSSQNFSKARTASADAYMDFDGTEYVIHPEVYGNEFDDADLQVIVRETTDKMTSGDRPQEDAVVEVPEALYFVPAVTQDDEEMNRTVDTYNKYCKAVITHTFGEEKLTIDWDTIQNWLILDEDGGHIDEEAVYNYVAEMAGNYDTLYYERSFKAASGKKVTLSSNDYGYQIDQDGEFSQLMADIESNTTVEREPVYAVHGFSRNGRDDLNGNYIEVNLKKQHLWLYRNGELVIETDFVSGLPKDGRETTTGAFGIAFKASPYNLKGGGSSGSGSWDVDVKYWMPFHDGQGLHDASWRNAFGGDIYKTNGSHGCVNLPTEAAAVIYENVDANFPILLYK